LAERATEEVPAQLILIGEFDYCIARYIITAVVSNKWPLSHLPGPEMSEKKLWKMPLLFEFSPSIGTQTALTAI
jgi:hypothetical protein